MCTYYIHRVGLRSLPPNRRPKSMFLKLIYLTAASDGLEIHIDTLRY